jgi:antitoxin component YwqK of YwqJK toxin-antitoxin module
MTVPRGTKNFKMRQIFILVTLIAVSCRQAKVKVLAEEYAKGKPKTVHYFDNTEDATQHPIVIVEDGIGHANKPVSFDEERYFENGKLYSKGRYVKGQTCGLWQYFYETGFPQAKCYYLNGISRDTVYCWYSSGILKRFLVEIDTVKHKWHGFDFYESGKKSASYNLFNYGDDKWRVDGEWSEWFKNGQQKFQATVQSNWTAGEWMQWDSAGRLTKGQKPINLVFE